MSIFFTLKQNNYFIMHVKKKSTTDLFPFSPYTVWKSLAYHYAILRHNNHLDYRSSLWIAYILILANYCLSFITIFRIAAEVLQRSFLIYTKNELNTVTHFTHVITCSAFLTLEQ
jgi:hypothetical protein